MQADVYIVGFGARTCLGLGARASAAAVRAGICRFLESSSFVDKWGEPVVTAAASYLPTGLRGSERFLALSLPALQEALAPLASTGGAIPPVQLFLGLPEARPGTSLHLDEVMQERIGTQASVAGVRTFRQGHVAGLVGLAEACIHLRDGEDFCLVGGVDSYIQAEALEWLDTQEQLKSPSQRWGLVPGEAAGFLLLASGASVARYHLPVLGRILSISVAREERSRRAGGVCLGIGLTQAMSGALSVLPQGARVAQVIGDLNGERHRTDEYGFSLTRLADRLVDGSRIRTPADCWGDVGAASGPLFIMLAAASGLRGYAPGPHALVWGSSEGGERAASLIEVPARMTAMVSGKERQTGRRAES